MGTVIAKSIRTAIHHSKNVFPIIKNLLEMLFFVGVGFLIIQIFAREQDSWQNVTKASFTNLTGLLVRDTRRDSRQLSSFSSVMPERSSWTYSWEERVHSCLLFLSPPCKQSISGTVIRDQQTIL